MRVSAQTHAWSLLLKYDYHDGRTDGIMITKEKGVQGTLHRKSDTFELHLYNSS